MANVRSPAAASSRSSAATHGAMEGPGARARAKAGGKKAARRATCPYINAQIVQVAERGDLDALLAKIDSFLPDMNLVNLSTALHRLAKMNASSLTTPQMPMSQRPVIQGLLACTRAALAKAEIGQASPHCQALSNITWSLATMQCPDIEIFRAAARMSLRHIAVFKPFELSAVLWAFAKMGSIDPPALQNATPLFQASASHISTNTELFSFRCLVMIVWAFGAAQFSDEALFRRVAAHMTGALNTAQCAELSNVAWSYAMLGVREERLMSEVSRRATQQLTVFKAADLCNLMWAFATLGCFEDSFVAASANALRGMELRPSQTATSLWSLSSTQPRHAAVRAAVAAIAPRCARTCETFEPQELATVALACARSFGGKDEGGISGALSRPVIDLFIKMLPFVVERLHRFPSQALADITTAYLAMGLGGNTNLYSALGREVCLRAHLLEPSALLLLMWNLPAAPRAACGPALACVFAEAARRFGTMRVKEVHEIIEICKAMVCLPGDSPALQPMDVLNICLSLSRKETWLSEEMHHTLFLDVRTRLLLDGSSMPWDCAASPSSQQNPSPQDQPVKVVAPQQKQQQQQPNQQHPRQHQKPHQQQQSQPQDVQVQRLLRNFQQQQQQAQQQPQQHRKQQEFPYQQQPHRVQEVISSPVRGGPEVRQVEQPRQPADAHFANRVNYAVKNTFVDLGNDVGEGSDDEEHPVKLPPPLDIIPSSVSSEKLEEYRVGYQKFRAGDALGARGEISTMSALDLVEAGGKASTADEVAEPATATRHAPEGAWNCAPDADGPSMSMGTPAISDEVSSQTGSLASRITKLLIGEEQLPPPLDFMPKVINLEKLASFRLDYQRFRAGHATGAKGEITSSTGASSSAAPAVIDDIALPPPLDIIPPTVSRDQLAAWRVGYQKFRSGDAHGARGEVAAATASDSALPTANRRSARHLSRTCSTCSDEVASSRGSLPPPVALSVKNTFVHIDVREGESGSDDDARPPLPPSLDCIPASVPPDVLEAYRHGYQRFRAGHASGAKGEVSSLVALDLFGLDGADGSRRG